MSGTPCSDPTCGAPCHECWKAGKGRHVHPSHLPTVIDVLEDNNAALKARIARLESALESLLLQVEDLDDADEVGSDLYIAIKVAQIALDPSLGYPGDKCHFCEGTGIAETWKAVGVAVPVFCGTCSGTGKVEKHGPVPNSEDQP